MGMSRLVYNSAKKSNKIEMGGSGSDGVHSEGVWIRALGEVVNKL